MAERSPVRAASIGGGAVLGALLRLGGHGRATNSRWQVLEPVGVVGAVLALGLLAVAVVMAIRSDESRGRPLGPWVRVLGLLGWGLIGVVLAVLALGWL